MTKFLQARGVSFAHVAQEPLLSNLSLSLADARHVALTGPNGGGKSTLLRILAGEIEADEGEVSRPSDVLYVPQFLESDFEARRSGGERRLARIRAALESGARYVLLDEPTNDLDASVRQELIGRLIDFGGAWIAVTHDSELLERVDEIWELKHGRIQHHPAGFEAYVARLENEESRIHERLRQLEREKRATEIKRREQLEGQQKRMVKGRKAAEKANLPAIIRGALERKAEATLARVDVRTRAELETAALEREQMRRRLRELSDFQWSAQTTRLANSALAARGRDLRLPGWTRPLNFEFRGPGRWRLEGPNGSGKSTLLKALAGDVDARIRLGGSLESASRVFLLNQDLSAGLLDARPLCEIFAEKTRLEISEARRRLGRLGFEQEEQTRPYRGLSGGERLRVELETLVAESPQLLLLDEPTNHLDLESRRLLTRFLERYEGACIYATHDERFAAELPAKSLHLLERHSNYGI